MRAAVFGPLLTVDAVSACRRRGCRPTATLLDECMQRATQVSIRTKAAIFNASV